MSNTDISRTFLIYAAPLYVHQPASLMFVDHNHTNQP